MYAFFVTKIGTRNQDQKRNQKQTLPWNKFVVVKNLGMAGLIKINKKKRCQTKVLPTALSDTLSFLAKCFFMKKFVYKDDQYWHTWYLPTLRLRLCLICSVVGYLRRALDRLNLMILVPATLLKPAMIIVRELVRVVWCVGGGVVSPRPAVLFSFVSCVVGGVVRSACGSIVRVVSISVSHDSPVDVSGRASVRM